jgi:ribosomal protein S18 acetylase RimI-like enzyme
MDRAELTRLEAIAFRAWPAAAVVEHRGMLLRHTGGESRRANSAAVYACDPGLSAAEVVEVAEAFYASHGRRAYLQIGPTAPEGLDEALAARGYAVEAPVSVQTAALVPPVAGRRDVPLEDARVEARIASEPDDAWIDIEVTRGRYADIRATFLGVLARLGPRAGFATAHIGGAPAAAGLLVLDDGVVVLAAMRTLPEARRRGAARAIVHAGVQWAMERGALVGYLQVEHDNDAALALYASEGFATTYGYHYRVLP